MKRKIVLAAFLLALLAGCGARQIPWTPEAKVHGLRLTLNEVTRELVKHREQGRFSAVEAAFIGDLLRKAHSALDSMDAAVELGQPLDELLAQVNYALRELVAARRAAEKRKADGTE